MNKIFLLNLPIQTNLMKDSTDDITFNPPLGVIALGSWVEFNGYSPIVIDLNYTRLSSKELLKRIYEEKPILIGISVYTENIEMAISTAKLIKQEFPRINILLGGPHPTLVPEDAINNNFVDFVIRKEGESALLELIEAILSKETLIKLESIPGLVFKRDGEIVNNDLRKPIQDLDILPISKRELAGINNYKDIINISTSRGCSGKCIFCSARSLSGAIYRIREIENVFLEIVMLKRIYGSFINKVFFIDETFTSIPSRVIKFSQLMKMYGLNINWLCASRTDTMSEELIDEMVSAKCEGIHFGIESGNQTVLDKIQKGIDLVYSEKMISYAYKKKIIPMLTFMLGHYCDTKETMEDTFNFIKKMRLEYRAEIAVYFNTPFPGTWQFVNREKIGMTIKAKSYKMFTLIDPVVETKEFTLNDQRKVFFNSIKYFERRTPKYKKAIEKVVK